MGVASGCGEQEVGVASGSGWNLWVWLLGVVLRRYIDFLILLIPTPLVSVLFGSSIPTSVFILLKYTVNGKIIARLNNCALLNFRAFRIYLWLKNCGCCTWSHYTIHTQDTRMRITRNSLRLNFCEDWW